MAAPLIWINGLPGTGKLTVAKELAALDSLAIVISNHSLIDPVARRLGPNSRSHPSHQEERKAERDKAFNNFVHNSSFRNRMLVFTDFQSTSSLGTSVAQEYELAAREATRPFVPVYLSCEAHVNLRRAMSDDREAGGTTKLTDETLLQALISGWEIYRFEGIGLDIETSVMSAKEAAETILAHCQKLLSSVAVNNAQRAKTSAQST